MGGFYPNGDEIRTRSEQRYGIKVEFDDTSKTFNISSGTTGDESTVKISDSTPSQTFYLDLRLKGPIW